MGNPLAVQWLGLGALTARTLGGELRSHKPCRLIKKKKKLVHEKCDYSIQKSLLIKEKSQSIQHCDF